MTGFLFLLGALISVSFWLWVQLRDTKQELIERMDKKIAKHEVAFMQYVNYKFPGSCLDVKRASPRKTSSPSPTKAAPRRVKTIRASKGSGRK
ncbi:MAG: hypothetical protein K940chlam3_00125 [Chlamydiae bacterium]|nr:hypothetical protein [Chlamydiota bacterium]